VQSIAPEIHLTDSAHKTLDSLLDALLSENYNAATAAKLTSNYLDLPETQLANERLGLLAVSVGGPRWWKDHVRSPSVTTFIKSHRKSIIESVKPITDAINNARDQESFDRLVDKLKKLVSETRDSVVSDYDTYEHHLPQFEAVAKHDDPVLHLRRFSIDMMQDLIKAEELCGTATEGSVSDGIEACVALANILEDLVSGARFVSVMADKIHLEVKQLADVPSEE
jgi:hypothetical protein